MLGVAHSHLALGQILRLPAEDDFIQRSGVMVPNQPHRVRDLTEGAGPRLYSPLDSGSVVSRRAWLAAGELSSTPEVKRVRMIELDALIRATLLPSSHLQRLVKPTRNVRVVNRQDWESAGTPEGRAPAEQERPDTPPQSADSIADTAKADTAAGWRTSLVRPSGYGPAPAYDYLLALASPEHRSRPAPDLEVCRQALADARRQANLGRWSAAEVYYTQAWLHLPEPDRRRIFSELAGY